MKGTVMYRLDKQIIVGCAVGMFLCGLLVSTGAVAARCLFVSSYHTGYAWNDGIERGLDPVLQGKCDLKKFYMDTQRNPEPAFGAARALEAKALIESYQPDVVIACDDPASKYLVQPYFKDAALPIVFCGINWTVDVYGYPYSNTTGMIEVSPVRQLIKQASAIVGTLKTATFLAADVLTETKEFAQVKKILAAEGVEITPMYVKTFAAWKKGYIDAQRTDLVYLSNISIEGWNDTEAAEHALTHARKLSVTTQEARMNYAMLGMVKIPEEQGEWAANVTLHILAGTKPAEIAIIPNSRWNIFANPRLLAKAHIVLPAPLLTKAIKK